MKKLLCAVLAITIFLLSGCSISKEITVKDNAVAGWVELNLDEKYLNCINSIASRDDVVVFLTTLSFDKQGNYVDLVPEEEEKNYVFKNFVIEYDLANNKLVNIIELKDCPIEEIWGLEINDDNNIVIYSDSECKNAVYDTQMNFIELTDRKIVDYNKVAEKSPFFYDSYFTVMDDYSYFIGDRNIVYINYYDEIDKLYVINDVDTYINVHDKRTNLFLTERNDENIDYYSIVDFRNGKKFNSAQIDANDYGFDFCSSNVTAMGDKYVVSLECFNKNDAEDYMTKMFCWRYNYEQNEVDLDVSTYTKDEFDNKTDEVIKRLADDYNIFVHINETTYYTEDIVTCGDDYSHIQFYDGLENVYAFCESLPEGMVKEIYSGFYNKENEREGIRLDVVEDISVGSAFANENETPCMEICFMFSTLSLNTISHEFMHLFDARIYDKINHDGAEDEWYEINKPYEHNYSDDEDVSFVYDYDEKNFVTIYASTNDLEDRAETFQYLYNCYGDSQEITESVVKQKADLLIKLIRDSFPSVQRVNKAIWE